MADPFEHRPAFNELDDAGVWSARGAALGLVSSLLLTYPFPGPWPDSVVSEIRDSYNPLVEAREVAPSISRECPLFPRGTNPGLSLLEHGAVHTYLGWHLGFLMCI